MKTQRMIFLMGILVVMTARAFDVTDLAKLIEYAAEQNTTLSSQLVNLKGQYQKLTEQYDAMTRQYGMGGLYDSDMTTRQWAPHDWHHALTDLSGGNSDRYQELVSAYNKDHETLSPDTYAKDKFIAQDYASQVATNRASSVVATYAFNDIHEHLKTLHQLGGQIDDAKNENIKSALDLNSRIQLEVAYIAMEELRMQTLINEQIAQMQSTTIVLENEAAKYNRGENL